MNSATRKLEEHLQFVRAHSPYFAEAWRGAWPEGAPCPGLAALPVTDHAGYWAANSIVDNRLLTAPHDSGIVFTSGGTTGNPKFSFFSNEDWREFCGVFGGGLRRLGLRPGERVANLFYGGQLYASLLFFGRSLEESGVGVHYPLAGFVPPEELIHTMIQFRIHTLAGVPTTILHFLPELIRAGRENIELRRVLFAGESMYPDQIAAVQAAYPGCRVQSVGIAGVDFGEIGWCDESCGPGEHYVFDESIVLEILDEENRPIEEPGVPGAIHATNFQRKLMPIIRYPVGDMGMWLEPVTGKPRRFQLLGRTEKGARVGPMTLYLEDFQAILSRLAAQTGHTGFQLVVDHIEQRDRCTLRIAVPRPDAMPAALADAIRDALYTERPMFPDSIGNQIIHPLVIEWVEPHTLLRNPRTGKLRRLVDRRFEA